MISVLAQQAAKQTSEPTDIPVVRLESDNGNIRIQKLDSIPAAVPKMASYQFSSSLSHGLNPTYVSCIIEVLKLQ